MLIRSDRVGKDCADIYGRFLNGNGCIFAARKIEHVVDHLVHLPDLFGDLGNIEFLLVGAGIVFEIFGIGKDRSHRGLEVVRHSVGSLSPVLEDLVVPLSAVIEERRGNERQGKHKDDQCAVAGHDPGLVYVFK